MEVVAATGAEPYLVLNYDSANKPSADPADSWGYDMLRDAAESWVALHRAQGLPGDLPKHGSCATRLRGLPDFAQQSTDAARVRI